MNNILRLLTSQKQIFRHFDPLRVTSGNGWEWVLDTAETFGPDNIPAVVLKTCTPGLSCYGFGIWMTVLKIAQVYPIQSGYKPSNPFSNQQQNGERWRLQFFNSRITHLFNLVFTRSTVLISQPWHNVDRSGELKRWGEHECTWYEGVISRH